MVNPDEVAKDQLQAFVERIERLEEDKKNIAEDIKDVYAEAKGNGFDVKIIRQVVKLRKLDPADRQEQEALLEIYMAALGMLAGTPLGEAARRRLSPKSTNEDSPPEPEPAPPVDEKAMDAAREEGRKAAIEGKRVIDNPYISTDPRRAAWDEGWCAQSGNDGMDIPDAWRRKEKPKKKSKIEEAGEE